MIQRGVAYVIEETDATGVVLTKDSWNNRMLGVGVVPIVRRSDTTWRLALPLDEDPEQVIDPTRLVVVPQDRVGKAVKALDDESLHLLEQIVGELIDTKRLLADPPRATRPPAGAIDYPRWGEIYYTKSDRVAGERKRYVVVSNDLWNQQKVTVLVARTTTQPKYPTDEFPIVERGEAQVVCGELAAVPAMKLDLDRRPIGHARLGLQEMASVVRGIVHTHLLRDHLAEFEADAASIES